VQLTEAALKAHLFILLYNYCVWNCNDSTVLYGTLESVCACYGAIEIIVIIIIIIIITIISGMSAGCTVGPWAMDDAPCYH